MVYEMGKMSIGNGVGKRQIWSWFSTICGLQSDIRYPEDWVLLRDVPRILLKAIKRIRRAGLFNRMEQTTQRISPSFRDRL